MTSAFTVDLQVFSSFLDFRIRATYLPESLQTEAMTEFEERAQAQSPELDRCISS